VLEVTADANFCISGLQVGGIALRFLSLARARAFQLAISAPSLTEIRRVLGEKFQWPPNRVADAVARVERFTSRAQPTHVIDAVPDDPDDNRVLECAVASNSAPASSPTTRAGWQMTEYAKNNNQKSFASFFQKRRFLVCSFLNTAASATLPSAPRAAITPP
jgi:predicted nucleic acid-binding protein